MNGPRSLTRNPTDSIFDILVFDNFILTDKLFDKLHEDLQLVYKLIIIYAEN